MSVTPPAFPSSTTSFTTLYYATGVNGPNYVPVSIPVQQGDVIGILGARGNTSTLVTSYGQSAPVSSVIQQQPVTLHRLVYQANLAATQAGALSDEPNGPIGRVELRYGP